MSEHDELDLQTPEPEEGGEGEEETLDGTKAEETTAEEAVEEEEAAKEISFDEAVEQGDLEATEEEGAKVAASDSEPDEEVPADQAVRIDLNAASAEELQELPGIGPALAESIVVYRDEVAPFREAAEIVQVPGISEGLYVRIAELVTVGPVAPVEEAEAEPELGTVEEAEIEPLLETEELAPEVELEPEAEPEPTPISAQVQVIPASRGPGWGSLILIGLLSLLAGAILALVVLFAVNGTLDFDSAIGRAVQAETSRLDDEIESLNVDLAQVEGRLQVLQGLAPELEDAKAEIKNLEDDLAAVDEELASVNKELPRS